MGHNPRTEASELHQGETEKEGSAAEQASRKHIRGSTILLIGRVISLALNFGVQVLTVRYLSKGDYGAFAYALSVVSMGASLSLFGLDKAVARFIPIYHERGERRKMVGAIVLTLSTIIGIGTALVLLVIAGRDLLGQAVINDPLALTALVLLIALSPLQALDSWFQGMFAVFAKPQAIFFRRHVLGPGLKLAAILVVILIHGSVTMLAIGYLVGGLLGLTAYVTMLGRLLREEGLLSRRLLREMTIPFREIFAFSSPLLTSDVVAILKSSMVVVLLGYFSTTVQVAEFRAVLPVATLNLVVMQSFKYLFTPLAARLFTREDTEGMNDLYWRTAVWVAIFTFPVFAVSFSLAQPLTVLLFGAEYASSGIVLAILAFGYYFNAAFGLNAYTLRVYGRVRYIVGVDVSTGILSLVFSLLLIPRYGAVGAALAVTGTQIAYNVLNHSGLLFSTGIDLFQWRYLRVYAGIVLAVAGLWALEAIVEPPLVTSLGAAALVTLILLRVNRQTMGIDQMFPEVRRIPVLRSLMATQEVG